MNTMRVLSAYSATSASPIHRTLSDGEEDRDGGDGPRKRVRQACLNCRKKKVRCSGEKPVCSLCKRLEQPCHYETPIQPSALINPTSPSTLEVGAVYAAEGLNAKLEALQDRLASTESTLHRVLPLLSTLVRQHLSPSPGSLRSERISQLPNSGIAHDTDFQPSVNEAAQAPSQLPPTHTLLLAADVFFRFCHNQPYSLFHEATFRQRLISGEIPTYLLWAFFGAASRFSTLLLSERDGYDEAVVYTRAAWKCIELPWSPSPLDENILPVLQTLILLVSIEHPAGFCSSAYMKLGFALRLALHARLHLEPNPNLSPTVKEERRRVFWSLYIQDKLISLSREKAPVLRDEQCRVRLPSSETAFRNGIEESTPELDALKGDLVDEEVINATSSMALVIVLASSLGRVTQYTLLEQSASHPGPPWSPNSPYAAIVANLLQLETHFAMNESLKDRLAQLCVVNGTVDQHVAGPLIYSRALFHLCNCLLHHPFLLKHLLNRSRQKAPPSFFTRAWELCRAHAASLTDLKRMKNHNVLLLTSLYGYCTMIAGTIHALSMHDQNPLVRGEAHEHYKNSMDFLSDLSRFWKHAKLMMSRLERIRQRSADHRHLLDPKQWQSGQTSAELQVMWQSVDYALLSTPTRPGSPSSEDPIVMPAFFTSESEIFDFDFAMFSGVAEAGWDLPDLRDPISAVAHTDFFETSV